MKVFVSWSGEYSKEVAKLLKDWIPCIIQSVTVFYSDEDIKKGEKWDTVVSSELSDSNYGIICLTQDNLQSSWLNFEAGAIAKAMESKVSALMINLKPSDINGPLARYQATRFEKDDFSKLIESINKFSDNPLEEGILKPSFESNWKEMENEWKKLAEKYPSKKNEVRKKEATIANENNAIEEILQLLRQQTVLLSMPERLLPEEYFNRLFTSIKKNEKTDHNRIENILINIDVMIGLLSINNTQENRECLQRMATLLTEISKMSTVSGSKNTLNKVYYLRDRCEVRGGISYSEKKSMEILEMLGNARPIQEKNSGR